MMPFQKKLEVIFTSISCHNLFVRRMHSCSE